VIFAAQLHSATLAAVWYLAVWLDVCHFVYCVETAKDTTTVAMTVVMECE